MIMKELEEENKRLNAIIVALLREKFEKSDFTINPNAKFIKFPMYTSMGLLEYKTEIDNFI